VEVHSGPPELTRLVEIAVSLIKGRCLSCTRAIFAHVADILSSRPSTRLRSLGYA
jgi:hypothetical protein